MPHPRSTTTTRTRRPAKKPVETPILVDTIADGLKDEQPKPPREKRPGPKKVLDETGKAIGDATAAMLAQASGSDAKALQFEEAQSITHPLARIIGRRLPVVLKKFAPKTQLNPDDAADVEEIAVTLGKYALRFVMLSFQEAIMKKEASIQQHQAVQENRPIHPVQASPAHVVPPELVGMPVMDLQTEPEIQRVGVSSNGHNPAFNVIGVDYGQAGE